jgi:hypothetical protein
MKQYLTGFEPILMADIKTDIKTHLSYDLTYRHHVIINKNISL